MDVLRALREFVRLELRGERPPLVTGATAGPATRTLLLSAIPAAGASPGHTTVDLGGCSVLLSTDSSAAARLEVTFGPQPSRTSRWVPLLPGTTVRVPDGRTFEQFHLRRRADVPSGALTESVYLVVDPGAVLRTADPQPRSYRASLFGTLGSLMRILDNSGGEVDVTGSDEGCVGTSALDTFSGQMERVKVESAGGNERRHPVNLIQNQMGVSAGAGAVQTNTPRVTLASDDPAVADLDAIKTAVQILDDWDETNRAAVNVISGQAGVAGDMGATGANVQRMVTAAPGYGGQGQVSVGSTSTQIVAAASYRKEVLIVNRGANSVFISVDGTPATTSDFELKPGESFTMTASTAIYGIVASGSETVHYAQETYY